MYQLFFQSSFFQCEILCSFSHQHFLCYWADLVRPEIWDAGLILLDQLLWHHLSMLPYLPNCLFHSVWIISPFCEWATRQVPGQQGDKYLSACITRRVMWERSRLCRLRKWIWHSKIIRAVSSSSHQFKQYSSRADRQEAEVKAQAKSKALSTDYDGTMG